MTEKRCSEMALFDCFERVRRQAPLVFCLTNAVTVTDCANILLASGASPVMSLDPREASDMAKVSNAVVVNMGTPSSDSVQAMLLAGRSANERGIPVVLDPVGAGATPLRAEIVSSLLASVRFALIRGNASEIAFLAGEKFSGRGVDAGNGSELSAVSAAVQALARKTDAVVCASGPVDVVSDGRRTLYCRNGHPMMPRITGSGCMSSALCGAFLGASPDARFEAVSAAVAVMGISGQIAHKALRAGESAGTFRMRLIDAVALFDETAWREHADCEEVRP